MVKKDIDDFMKSKGIIGIGVISIVVIIAGAFLLLNNKRTSNATTVVSNNSSGAAKSTVIANTSSSKTSNLTTNTSTVNTSTVQNSSSSVVLSNNQMQTLLGVSGNYSITTTTGSAFAAQLNKSIANTTNTYSTYYNYLKNGTEEWNVIYKNTTSSGNISSIEEIIVKSTTPKIALKFFGLLGSKYNVTNATMNGLTYNYASSVSGQFSFTALEGYKGDYATIVLVSGKQIAQTELASAVTSDIPS